MVSSMLIEDSSCASNLGFLSEENWWFYPCCSVPVSDLVSKCNSSVQRISQSSWILFRFAWELKNSCLPTQDSWILRIFRTDPSSGLKNPHNQGSKHRHKTQHKYVPASNPTRKRTNITRIITYWVFHTRKLQNRGARKNL